MKRWVRVVVAGALVAGGLTPAWAAAAEPATGCGQVPQPRVPGATVLSVTAVAKPGGTVHYPPEWGVPPITGVPPFCEVTTLLTHPGAKDRVTVRMWFPRTGWNGRFQATGGGGFSMHQGDGPLALGVKAGYAAGSTDGGIGFDFENPAKWALDEHGRVNRELLKNFAYRSLHDLAVAGKALTSAYYGQAPEYSYWNGCSTGGRQGMMLAQRFPRDFDGISAAAPALNWNRLVFGDLWPQVVMNSAKVYPSECEFAAARQAAIQQCDPDDGLVDGIVRDPGECDFDPRTLIGRQVVCKGHTLTVTAADAEVLRRIWAGPRTASGLRIWPGYDPSTDLTSVANTVLRPDGTTTAGRPFQISENWVKYFLKEDPGFDIRTVDYRAFDRLFAQSYVKYRRLIETADPDLTTFRRSGGKMITWHGSDDSVIHYGNTLDYLQRVKHRMGDPRDFFRVYLAPGGEHCGPGSGPAALDPLTPLVDWVEKGKAPETLPGAGYTGATRDLCLYPRKSYYNGSGDPKQAASYTCR